MPRNLIKACLPCHQKKLKCDAVQVGLPCTRCKAKDLSQHKSCIRVLRHQRRVTTASITGSTESTRGETSHVLPLPASGRREARHITSLGSSYSDAIDLHYGHKALLHPDKASDQDSQALIRECKEIAEGDGLPAPEMMLDLSPDNGRDVVQYHSEMHYATMMGEVATEEKIRRVTRVIIKEKEPPIRQFVEPKGHDTDNQIILDAIDPTDREYLTQKSAFTLPPKRYCEALLQSYFRLAYPTCPVFDPSEFTQSCDSGTHSLLLLQAVLANAALYVPQKILEESGFATRLEALETFCIRATLLYDFQL
ncbi:hypothetical protein V8C42DRAFT_257647 [Trichoderma barbatum]